ncbi:DNA-binding response regulator [Leptotrichia sp. OH3620_COT-345]|uniref:response regulator transcription factor n=1 Tax=Leptotrichia sp. OH3620_COT-345 TaxID=2491048 RepID=UPI000F64A32B|nr:response regulator transcription factor [Leptotrichia sp. OH3620_COT-345]RRD40500.1 DNA-binding response regulator [Leptotrichia sp. OH3620_COT-345]
MGKILVVEDDEKIVRILKIQLEHENHEVSIETNGIDALNNINKNREYYDLVILDLGLPGMEGNKVCKNIRKISEVPVIVLSARNSTEEKVELLRSGASDYVTKPFDMPELNARIDINIRKKRIMELIYRNIKLNTENYSVIINGNPVIFSKTEYELLKILVENKEEIVSRDKIVEKVWGWNASDNLLDSTMKKIRQKLEKNIIKTVRGIGYILKYEENTED